MPSSQHFRGPGNGFAHDPDEDDHAGLYQYQHPASPAPPRFSSPSRPRKGMRSVTPDVRSWGTGTAVYCIIQSLVWAGMSVAAALVYREIIPSPNVPDDQGRWDWDDLLTLLSNLYFKESPLPKLPDTGLVTPRWMYRLMAATLAVNAIWLITSSIMFRAMRFGDRGFVKRSAMAWSVSLGAVTVVDVLLAAAMIHDLVVILDWTEADAYPYATTLRLCPAVVLVAALRGGILFAVNVVCVVMLLLRLSKLPRPDQAAASRRDPGPDPASDSPSATKREGPIDAYLYRNDDRRVNHSLGVQNPVFVPDEVEVATPRSSHPLASFGQQEGRIQRSSGYHQGPDPQPQPHPHPQPQPYPHPHPVAMPLKAQQAARDDRNPRAMPMRRVPRDDLDDVSHLSWMEEPGKHVDMRVRSVARPSAPPHYRYGVVEHRDSPRGHDPKPHPYDRDSMLPRARINPNAPRYPAIPPPDYSPPSARRATGKAGQHGQHGQHPHPYPHPHTLSERF